MSLLSNSQLRVRLLPGAVEAALWRGWPRPVKIADQRCPVDVSDGDALASTLDIALAKLAQDGAPTKDAVLHAELADAIVHFDVASGNFAGQSQRQLRAFANACVVELLGDATREHSVHWQMQSDEQHLLVCAVPNAVLRALTSAAATHAMRLAGIRPSFARAWNRHARRSTGRNLVFASVAGLNAMIACAHDGVVNAVSSGPWGEECAAGESQVTRLRSGFGLLDVGEHALLDLQVDRLLAGLGFDATRDADFLFVSAGEPPPLLSNRWTIIQASGVGA